MVNGLRWIRRSVRRVAKSLPSVPKSLRRIPMWLRRVPKSLRRIPKWLLLPVDGFSRPLGDFMTPGSLAAVSGREVGRSGSGWRRSGRYPGRGRERLKIRGVENVMNHADYSLTHTHWGTSLFWLPLRVARFSAHRRGGPAPGVRAESNPL